MTRLTIRIFTIALLSLSLGLFAWFINLNAVQSQQVESVSLSEVQEYSFFEMKLPQQVAVSFENGTTYRFSDNSDTNFDEIFVQVKKLEDVFSEELQLDEDYCLQGVGDIAKNILQNQGGNAFHLSDWNYLASENICKLEFQTENADTELYYAKQFHTQEIYQQGDDEIMLEVVTTNSKLNVNDIFRSFRLRD